MHIRPLHGLRGPGGALLAGEPEHMPHTYIYIYLSLYIYIYIYIYIIHI